MQALREAALEREKRRKENQSAAAETTGAEMGNTHMQNSQEEEEKKREDEGDDGSGVVNAEMEDTEKNKDDEEDQGWDEDDDEGEGWDDYAEEDEMDEVVKQALEQTRKKKELEQQIDSVTITYRPAGYNPGMVAQIVGDFTDWVPFTMHMHSVQDMHGD